MQKSKGPPREPPELQQDDLIQRREIVMMLTCDDMALQLQKLARDHRHGDCAALREELGDWRSYGQVDLAPVLHVSYIGER